ncbi:MAG: hypothetical protein KAI83_20200 [Thiomargarita sp.]|nr:hypothetical protein [Thiomargarita sp.]
MFSVIMSMLFYRTFGEGFISFVYASTAILLDLAGILMLHFIGRALAQGGYLKNETIINQYITAYGFLFTLSLLAAYGFSLEAVNVDSQKRLANSAAYQQAVSTVENAKAKMESLSGYAGVDIGAANGEIANQNALNAQSVSKANAYWSKPAKNSANARAGTIGKVTNRCNPAYATGSYGQKFYYNRYCPNPYLNGGGNSNSAQAKIEGFQAYQAANTAYSEALERLKNTAGSSTDSMHPLWIQLGNFFGANPKTVLGVVVFFFSFFVELMGGFIVYHRKKLGLTRAVTQKRFDDGIAIQHEVDDINNQIGELDDVMKQRAVKTDEMKRQWQERATQLTDLNKDSENNLIQIRETNQKTKEAMKQWDANIQHYNKRATGLKETFTANNDFFQKQISHLDKFGETFASKASTLDSQIQDASERIGKKTTMTLQSLNDGFQKTLRTQEILFNDSLSQLLDKQTKGWQTFNAKDLAHQKAMEERLKTLQSKASDYQVSIQEMEDERAKTLEKQIATLNKILQEKTQQLEVKNEVIVERNCVLNDSDEQVLDDIKVCDLICKAIDNAELGYETDPFSHRQLINWAKEVNIAFPRQQRDRIRNMLVDRKYAQRLKNGFLKLNTCDI